MVANQAECVERLIQGGFLPTCPTEGCAILRTDDPVVWHEWCRSPSLYQPVQGLGCYNALTSEWQFWGLDQVVEQCEALHAQDPRWTLRSCYCCCGSPFGAAIDVPGGSQAAGSIAPGAAVLAGSLVGPQRALAWRPATVTVSIGVDGGRATMIQVVYGDDRRGLVVPPDQVVLLADRTLTTAAKLVPGDQLIDRAGRPVAVRIVSHGEQEGGTHHLATSSSCQGSVEDHLLVAGGVVVGDYALQLGFAAIPAALKAADHEARPSLGTEAYRTQHAALASDAIVERYATRHDDLAHPSGAFTPTTRGGRAIPEDARGAVTREQTTKSGCAGGSLPACAEPDPKRA